MKEETDEDMLIRYILGETTDTERDAMELWLKEDKANMHKLEQAKFILEQSQQLAQQSPADENEQWEKFKVKRDALNNKGKVRSITTLTPWLQMAAAILIFAGGASVAYYFYNQHAGLNGQLQSFTSKDKAVVDTLSDGSIVHLNRYSSVSCVTDFKKTREVKLTGEAFFEVKHNASVPFIVHTDGVNIRDIGTAFNVKSHTKNVEVVVESGIVRVSKDKAAVQLNPQQKVVVNNADKQLHVEASTDLLYNYYRSNEFIANKTPLWRVIETINEAYDSHIVIADKRLSNLPLTGTFKKESVDKFLQVLLLTTPDLRMEQVGDNIILKSK
ncbi:FecR domain-containing protein [Mucilaginibacter jinjuensis]|uniref:FecR domain-containing protein n=1 Tax=Mucilaginibacter jinjuensis TaxID=1176721 RepID=A0ABY7T3L8_9SPHI|nr:FecR domain-containing protein [Mucilaginibacter jinjuensis]WCT11040.1 FecR domain-containing protein [Mucilaginibacter jinjuensis]